MKPEDSILVVEPSINPNYYNQPNKGKPLPYIMSMQNHNNIQNHFF